VGLNYKAHAAELKMSLPEEPLIFLKPSTAVIGPEGHIIYPPSSRWVDYEAELGVVIGKTACRISKGDARHYVLGYTCFDDVTARDQQPPDGQWTRSKSYDSFAPLGPWIETELDPDNVSVCSYLNGQLKQNSNTNDLIFPVMELVSFISHIMTLLPGDIIATGTPGGVGPMLPGDTIEIKIGGIGILKNYVVAQK
jgi:2-keto-4-pentenoate hydratase/2-oxohepta-3-ene-1,7-dioic acid hydratase in catechol pathway